ncbi:MAG: DegT/DnrJ/EryC1/StrS family aminotransferase [Isosphaeraceae bacterium]
MIRTTTAMRIPLSQPSIDADDVAAVLGVLRTPTLSMGPKVRDFERAMARYAGAAEAVAVNSGTSGLHLCLAAAGVGPGDEVITTPFSFVASANCALYQGARPVFADIDEDTLNIDPQQVEDRIGPRTRALLPVDVFGQPAPIERLLELAARRELVVIRDSCEAIGAERQGLRIGSEGLATVFAFYPNKQMTTGEGGMIVTNDVEYSRILRSLCNQGRDDHGTWMRHVRLGLQLQLDEMSAAWGSSQLGRIDSILDRRARIADWYAGRSAATRRSLHIAAETTRMSWFVYVIRLDPRVDRTALMEDLERDGVPAALLLPDPLSRCTRERFGHRPGGYPSTGRPIHPRALLHRHE